MKMVPDFTEDKDHNDLSVVLKHTRQSLRQSIRRPINPYVISTPTDFTEEKEFLRNTIFPEIEKVCKQRGTYFSPTNLEWNPSHPSVAGGHGLRLSLDLIARSSPFCIALLGERYGQYRHDGSPPLPRNLHDLSRDADWLDQNYVIAASAGHSWLLGEAHQNCSMMELEVMQAAFLNDNDHCVFYFRQPEHLDHKFLHLSEQQRERKLAHYLAEDDESNLRLRDLKQRVIKKGLYVKYFCSLSDLGRSVLGDWRAIIDILYPPLSYSPKPIGSEAFMEITAMRLFEESRKQTFLSSPEINSVMDQLSGFSLSCLDKSLINHSDVLNQNKPFKHSSESALRNQISSGRNIKSLLALTGDRGSGKSALICNWINRFQQDNPHVKVISHYIGSHPHSSDISLFMDQCKSELRDHFIDKDFSWGKSYEPSTGVFTEICESFSAALSLGPCVLVIDGIDRLGSSSGCTLQQIKSLSWLPNPLPSQCRVILTTVQSDLVFKSLRTRSDVQYISAPLVNTLPKCGQYLQEYAKSTFHHLHRNHLLKIWESNGKLKTNPLFLSLLANELRLYDVFTNLDVYAENLLEVVGVREYWSRCLHRWVATYSWTTDLAVATTETTSTSTGGEGFAMIGWVADALRLLTVSRFGLRQSELLCILKRCGYNGQTEVSEFDWLLFRECLGNSLNEGPGGLLTFSNEHLKECIDYTLLGCVRPGLGEITLLSGPMTDWQRDRAVYHLHLASYFSSHPDAQRRVQELPWHLLMAREISTLLKSLSNPEILLSLLDEDGMWPCNKQDFRLYWKQLSALGYQPSKVYLTLVSSIGLEIEDEQQSFDDSLSIRSVSPMEGRPPTVTPRIQINTVPTAESYSNKELAVEEKPALTQNGRPQTSRMSQMKLLTTEKLPQPDATLITNIQKILDNYKLDEDMISRLTLAVGDFLVEQGETNAAEKILEALYEKMSSVPTLNKDDQLLLSRVEERLGGMCIEKGDRELGETWYRTATKTLTDIHHFENTSEFGKLLLHHGDMMIKDGFDEDADEFYLEAQNCLQVCQDVPSKALVLYKLGKLRILQGNYSESDKYLRECLIQREQWFGQAHPLVAETLYLLAQIISTQDNKAGYNKLLGETLLRRTLVIQEKCLGLNHPTVATTLLSLGKLLQQNAGLSMKRESVECLKRALDIRITQFGSTHPGTKEARLCLYDVEVSLKLGQYAFGSAKPSDTRTVERPYSSLSWRDHELKEKQRSTSKTTLAAPGSSLARAISTRSRPQSSVQDTSRPMSRSRKSPTINRQSSYDVKARSITLPPTTQERPKSCLLKREIVSQPLGPSYEGTIRNTSHGRALPSKTAVTFPDQDKDVTVQTISRRQIGLLPAATSLTKPVVGFRGSVESLLAPAPSKQSIAVDISVEDDDSTVSSGFHGTRSTTGVRPYIRPGSGPARLYHRFNNAQFKAHAPGRSSSAVEPRGQISTSNLLHFSVLSPNRLALSAKSSKSQFSAINKSDVYSLGGPKSSLDSLLEGAKIREVLQRKSHHKSAWYHVPGRYITPAELLARKRSQNRPGSSLLKMADKAEMEKSSEKFCGEDVMKLDDIEAELSQMSRDQGDVSIHPSHVKFTEAVIVG